MKAELRFALGLLATKDERQMHLLCWEQRYYKLRLEKPEEGVITKDPVHRRYGDTIKNLSIDLHMEEVPG